MSRSPNTAAEYNNTHFFTNLSQRLLEAPTTQLAVVHLTSPVAAAVQNISINSSSFLTRIMDSSGIPLSSSNLTSSAYVSGDASTSTLSAVEPDSQDFKTRAVIAFTFIGFAFLGITLFLTFVVSLYWSITDSCARYKRKQQEGNNDNGNNGGYSTTFGNSFCNVQEFPDSNEPQPGSSRSMTNSSINNSGSNGGKNNGASSSSSKIKKTSSTSSLASKKYKDTGPQFDQESVSVELLEWDRRTEVIDMEEL